MAEIRYIFGDALTGSVIDEIPMQGVTVSDGIDGGEFQGSFGVNQTGRDSTDLIGATMPGKSFLVIERDGLPIWGGLVWSRTYQTQAESVQLFAKTYDRYPEKRVIDYDATFTNQDPRNIMRALYLTMQDDPLSIKVDVPSAFDTLETVSLTLAGTELKTYKSVFDELAADTFEWRIAWRRESGVYVKTLVISYPTLGQPLSDTSVTLDYPGGVLNFWRNDTIAQAGTNVYATGAGEGDSMPIVEVVHADLQTNNWPRFDTVVSNKGIDDSALLTKVAQQQAQILKAPSSIFTVELRADRDPVFGEYGVGDWCRLSFRSAYGETDLEARILQWDYNPPSGETAEEVRLTFEGDDLS